MRKTYQYLVAFSLTTVVFASCHQHDSNSPGYEYTPDMYRSPAIEAYVDYGLDPWILEGGHAEAEAQRLQTNRLAAMQPVAGTIPFSSDPDKAMFNFPYSFPNTMAGYDSAGVYLRNPIEWSEEVVAEGGELYNRMCAHCHGETGAGDGTVVTNSVMGYAVPNDFKKDVMMGLNEGHMFHAISYGKGMGMGAHASQLSKEERWKVVHFIRTAFQDKDPNSHNWTPGGEVIPEETIVEQDTTSTP